MFRLERLLCRNVPRIFSRNHIVELMYFKTGIRDIMSAARLGLDRYAVDRKKFNLDLQGKEDHFKDKMAQVVAKNSAEFVFTNDIKIMVHLAKDDDDLGILISMLKKYSQPNSQLRFSNYILGPVVMRLYYFLNKPFEAMALLEDKELGKLFNQVTSFVVLLDLLYEHQFYEEVIEIFKEMIDRQLSMNRFNREAVFIFFAACYKLNTPESFKEAEKIWIDMKDVQGDKIWYRIKVLFAILAVNQNQPNIAVEILSAQMLTKENLNVYVLALAKSNRLDDAISILRSFLLKDTADLSDIFLTKDTVEKLEEIFNEDEIYAKTFKDLLDQYRMHSLLSEKVLDDFFLAEVPPVDNLRDDGGSRSREFRPFQKNRSQRY